MKTVQSGKLILGDVTFKLEDSDDTKSFVFDSDEKEGTITISFDIAFQDGEYQNETVSPFISIQQHETGKSSIEISDKRVHIQLEGVAVVDGYADPYETTDFSGDVWLCCE